jgi:putative transposase
MARKPRPWWPGAIYHIMCRGNHRHEIYRDDEDRQVYRSVLSQVKLTHPFIIHSYCMMTNHVHLQLETKDIPLGTIMKMINMKYAIYFNKKYHFVGQLMQGRFRSEIIDTDEYFLAISRYIHLNPVKAKMVANPLDYKWSSCREYFMELPVTLVETQKTLGYFSQPARERYKEYLEEGISGTVRVNEAMWESLLREDEEDNPQMENEEVQ